MSAGSGPAAARPDAGPLCSVIVPVLDERAEIAAVLDHLGRLPGRWEVIVADGGSRDATVAVAEAHRLRPIVMHAPPGRARQQNAAAERARGDVLVFLHADSRLPRDAHASIAGALRAGFDGGNYALRFDGGDRFSRVLTSWYRWQRRAGVFYGDSTIWIRRERFVALGGFPDQPIMEDYALARALVRSGRATCLAGPATTSARRWRALGVPRTVASWVVIRWLWLAGVPAERLARLYRPAR